MNVTTTPKALRAALSLAGRAVSPRGALPVLQNVLLDADADGLRISATNLDLTVVATVESATVVEPGRATLPASLLAAYVATLPQDEGLTMSLDPSNQVATIHCGLHTTSMHGIAAVDFPPLPSDTGTHRAMVDGGELQQRIEQAAPQASTDDARPVLMGINIKLEGGQATLEATDGHRLAKLRAPLAGEPTDGFPAMILPSRYLAEVAKAINPSRPSVEISLDGNHAFFRMRDVVVAMRLIEGMYPNVDQVIPATSATMVRVDRDRFLQELRTTSVLAKDAANVVRVRVNAQGITLAAQTAEVGDDEAPIDAEVTGPAVDIALNSRYAKDIVDSIPGQILTIALNSDLSPVVFRAGDRDDATFVAMPVKLPSATH